MKVLSIVSLVVIAVTFLIQGSNAQESKSFWDLTRENLVKLGSAIKERFSSNKNEASPADDGKSRKSAPGEKTLDEAEKAELQKAENGIKAALENAKQTLEKIGEELKRAAEKLLKKIQELFTSGKGQPAKAAKY